MNGGIGTVSEAEEERWRGGRADVRLGVVGLRDVEEAARDSLEGPELGESDAL